MTAPTSVRRGPVARFLRNPVLWSIVGLLVIAIVGTTVAVGSVVVRNERDDAEIGRAHV